MYTRTAVAVTPARRGRARSPAAPGSYARATVTVAMSAPVDPEPDVRSSRATPAGSARPRTLPALFEASVERFAPSVLVREKCEGTWQDTTFADMRTLVHRCAAGLIDLGLAKGDRVALISEGRREWPVAELGILYAGAINVPISVRLEELPELRFRLSHAGCRMLVASGTQARKVLTVAVGLLLQRSPSTSS